MSEATATAGLDYPDVPNDAQWNEMLQRELLCGKDAKDVPDELVKEVLKAIDVKRADSLQLAPYMHQKSILTDREHAQLINRQITDLDRRNRLTEIMMQRYRVGWLLRFCQCLLESYACEQSLGDHYKLFQQIKEKVHSLLLGDQLQQDQDTQAETVAKKIKSVPVFLDAKEKLIQKLQLDGHRHSLGNLTQVTTSDVADTWLSANKTRDWEILVEALLTEPGLGHAVSGVLPLSLSNPPAVWNYVRSLDKEWDSLAKYLGYSDALISHIKSKRSWDTKSQIQDFMRVCLIPDCGEQRTEQIVEHFKQSVKSRSNSDVPAEHKDAAGSASKPREVVADQGSKVYPGAAYQPSQMPAKQTNPWKFDDHHLKGTKRDEYLASQGPAASSHVERALSPRSLSADDGKPPNQTSLSDPPRLRSDMYRRVISDDPNRKIYSGVPFENQPREVEKDDGQGLMQACISEEWDVAQALISSGSMLEAQDKDGRTPLHICCIKGKVEIVRLLIEHGANATAKDNLDNCCLHHKETLKKPEVASEVITAFVKRNVSVDQANKNGVTPLMVACLSGDICCQAALILITHDARVNGLPNIDDKPLICASAGGNIKLVKQLLTSSADIDQKHGRDGSTALIQACLCNHPQIVRVLLEYNPNANLADKDGTTALAASVSKNAYEMVQLLIEKGGARVNCTRKLTSVNIAGSVEETPLASACARGYRDIAELLIYNGANVNYLCSGSVPPVGFAIICRQEHILKFLLEVEGYDKSIYGLRVPIDIAVRAGNFAAAKILLDARGGAEIAVHEAQQSYLYELADQIQIVQSMPKEELLSSTTEGLVLRTHVSSEMRDQTVKVEEVLQRFCQICMSAITHNMDCETLLGILKGLGAPQHIASFTHEYYRCIQRPDILKTNFLNNDSGMSPATFFITNQFVDAVRFHVHALEFYPEGPDEFYHDLVFTFHQISGGEDLPFDVNSVLERLFSGQFSLNVRTATIGQLHGRTSVEYGVWSQPHPQPVLPYHGETDGCVSTAPPINMSRPLINGVEMRQSSEHASPLHTRAVSLPEGEGKRNGMSSAREPKLQQPSSSDIGSPLKIQQSVPAKPQEFPNAAVCTESPVPSRSPAYKLQCTSPSGLAESPESSVITTGGNKELPISVEEDTGRYKDEHHVKPVPRHPERLLLHDTSEVKHDLSDPETPEDERKNVFGEVIKPSVEDTVQPHSKTSSRILPSGKTAASARSKQNATKLPQPSSRYGMRGNAAVSSSSTKARGTHSKVVGPFTSMRPKGAQNPLYSMQKSASPDQTTKHSPKARPSTATAKKPQFEGPQPRSLPRTYITPTNPGPLPMEGTFQEGAQLQNDPKLKTFIRQIKETGTVLGVGAFGCVVEVEVEGKLFAAKRFQPTMMNEKFCKKFSREYALLENLNHPNIVRYHGIHFPPKETLPLLIMERLATNLHSHLLDEHNSNLPICVKTTILCDIAKGLAYLHAQKPVVIHRDLTAKNTLINFEGVAKIADFGNSQIIDISPESGLETMTGYPGTRVYLAPEALCTFAQYNVKLDIFSFGHLALFTAIQLFPMELKTPNYFDRQGGLRARTEIDRRRQYIDNMHSNLGHDHHLVALIEHCLHNKPKQRPSANRLVSELEQMLGEIGGPSRRTINTDSINDQSHGKPRLYMKIGSSSTPDIN